MHLGDWKCEIWNGVQKTYGGMPEEKATIRVVELGVRYRGPMSNEQEKSLEVESGKNCSKMYNQSKTHLI